MNPLRAPLFTILPFLFSLSLTTACSVSTGEPGEPDDDVDTNESANTTATDPLVVEAMLAIARSAPVSALTGAGMRSDAANEIFAAAANVRFTSLADIDAVPRVGPVALSKLRLLAETTPIVRHTGAPVSLNGLAFLRTGVTRSTSARCRGYGVERVQSSCQARLIDTLEDARFTVSVERKGTSRGFVYVTGKGLIMLDDAFDLVVSSASFDDVGMSTGASGHPDLALPIRADAAQMFQWKSAFATLSFAPPYNDPAVANGTLSVSVTEAGDGLVVGTTVRVLRNGGSGVCGGRETSFTCE